MVHGFDVRLAPQQLEALMTRTKPLLDQLNLELLIVRTTSRKLASRIGKTASCRN
jgi:hypothetical protein